MRERAAISIAWFWSPCLITKSSLAMMAAAPPSEVGQHIARVKYCVTFLSAMTWSVVIELVN